jgi:hypothetical protein
MRLMKIKWLYSIFGSNIQTAVSCFWFIVRWNSSFSTNDTFLLQATYEAPQT